MKTLKHFVRLLFVFILPFFISNCEKQKIEPEILDADYKSAELSEMVNIEDGIIVFGPEMFVREKGKPQAISKEIPVEYFEYFEETFSIVIQNGDDNGDNRVTSAVVKIDGEIIFGPNDFKKATGQLIRELDLSDVNKLEVEIGGAPGSFFAVSVIGTLLPGQSLIAEEGGEIISENITIFIPQNTFTKNEIISIEEKDFSSIEIDQFQGSEKGFKIETTADLLNSPVTIRMYYDEAEVGEHNEEDMVIVIYDEMTKELEYVDCFINTIENYLEIETQHFSDWWKGFFKFKWTIDKVNYYIYPDPSNHLWGREDDPLAESNIVEASVESWNQYQGSFELDRVFNEDEAQIILKPVNWIPFGSGKAKVAFRFRDKDEDSKVKISFDDSQRLYNGFYNYRPEALISVVVHEIGHAIGLHHHNMDPCNIPGTNNPAAPIMNVGADFEFPDERAVTVCDLEELLILYDPPNNNGDENTFGDFAITSELYPSGCDRDQIINDVFGNEYRVAEWHDLVKFHVNIDDITVLMDGLGLTEYGNSAQINFNGRDNWISSPSRYYFCSRHNHNKRGSYLAHSNIDNYSVSLGSWWFNGKPIMGVKKSF